MNFIKPGDYVRTNKGLIGKFIREYTPVYPEPREWLIETDNGETSIIECDYHFIDISSERIIDLIKPGDYVNGEKVARINEPCSLNGKRTIIQTQLNKEFDYNSIYENEIKTIVTKEQFEEMEYGV